jgi:hypothetical protein
MTRLTFALVLIAAACSGKSKGGTTTGGGSGSDGPAVMAKKIALSWGITPQGEMADIYLATTDETGKQLSHAVGTYKGKCAVFTPAKEMTALTGVSCTTSGGGTELHAVRRLDEIVVVQMGTQPGVTPDPMAREEVTHIKIPTGIAVEVAP